MADSDLEKWLSGDSTLQQQIANFNKSKTDYLSQWTKQQQQSQRDYTTSNRALQQQGVTDRDQQMNDFAGHGILHSGVYGNALADYNKNFNIKVQNLNQGLNDTMNNQNDARTNFLRQLQFEQDQARQDAIRRRAQSLGL